MENKMIDLMTPRYLVVADYPSSEYPKGMIIDLSQDPRYVSGNVMGALWSDEKFFDSYTQLFQPLAWYEKRDIKDMPQYVKVNYVSDIWCVTYKVGDIIPCSFIDNPLWMHTQQKHFNALQMRHFTPATATEYDNYIKQKI